MLNAAAGDRFTYQAVEYIDTLDAQIEMNNDQLINKILYYLSRLPNQFSFSIMRPKLRYLCEYSRFYDYLDSWPQQTAQMKATRVLWTEMNKGMNQIAENCSYLRAQFFEEHPTEKPVKAKALDIDRRSSLMMSESGSFGTLDL